MITVSNALAESPVTVEDALPSALPRYQPGMDLRGSATAQAAVAASLPALAGTDLVFGRNEPGVQHFHRSLARYLD